MHPDSDVHCSAIYNCFLKKKKYLGVNLTKHIQDLYAKNDKVLIKKIKEYLIKRRSMFKDWKTQHSKGI